MIAEGALAFRVTLHAALPPRNTVDHLVVKDISVLFVSKEPVVRDGAFNWVSKNENGFCVRYKMVYSVGSQVLGFVHSCVERV